MSQANEMLDFDLDQLEELPEFVVLPAGVYILEGVELTQPSSEKFGLQVQVQVKVLETVELKNPETDKPVEPGTPFSWSAPLENPDDLFWIKAAMDNITKILRPVGQMYGVKTFLEVTEKFPGTQFAAVVSNRSFKDADGETKKSANIKSISVE